VDTLLTGLLNPTGITFAPDGTLYLLEAGRSRVLRVVALDKADRTASATALS
jgi:sugar lactone lactonase YvrE